MKGFVGKHILIIIENLPAPFDRRVWQEANALKQAGAEITIVCPQMEPHMMPFEQIDDIEIYRHPMPKEGEGPIGYLKEYTAALWHELRLAFKVYRRKRFHVIQGCNPPDLIFLVALPFKLFGVKYVFDHHDVNPELYLAKFGKRGFFYWLMLLFERMTFWSADFSIATNESYKSIAISRGKMKEERVQVIRSGPSLDRLKLQEPKEEYKQGKQYLIGYLGVIGQQEGIDLLLEAIAILLEDRDDFRVAIVGGGTAIESLKELSNKMGLNEAVTFYGRVSDQLLLDILNTADVCVNPDRPTEMNDLSTMNKIMEYMALRKPIVQFDLKEGRFSAQTASLYAKNTEVRDFADKINELLNSDDLRERMGNFGRERVLKELSWDHEREKLTEFYAKVLN